MNLSILEILFWVGLSISVYVYLAYPLLLFYQSKSPKNRKTVNCRGYSFSITLFIPAYNEESVISDKIDNALSLKYPTDLLEVAIASDGSTDRTNEILEEHRSNPRVKIFYNETNEGKNALINKFVPLTDGQIIVFTDANSIFSEESLLTIVRHFSDSTVGCVGGKLTYLSGQSAVAKGEGLYFKYENVIRSFEGKQGKMVGANGAIYAIRRELFEAVPAHVPNDFFHPLVVLKKGYQTVFEEKAIAFEKATESHEEEFKRRSRIVERSVSAIVEVNRRYGVFSGRAWFNIFSHKILRWLTFPILVCIWALNLFLLHDPLYLTLFICQTIFYILGALGYLFEKADLKIKIFYIPYYFMLINLAAFVGMLQWLRGNRIVSWKTASTTR